MQGDILAFADDILVSVEDQKAFTEVIGEFRRLEEVYGLSLNTDKTKFISDS